MKVSSIFTSHGSNKIRIIIASCLFAGAVMGGAVADSTTARITPEAIVRFLMQDLFVSPGIGFEKVQIGQTFTHVAKSWGHPNKAAKPSETGYVVWEYDTGDSKIRVAGGSKVTSIKVIGTLNSPFASSEGASFGMTPQQVITIYGAPSNSNNLAKLRYPDKGIEFGFEHGALKWISVFSPKS